MNHSSRHCAALCIAVLASTSFAQGTGSMPWMSPEVGEAWNQGFKGQGVTITVIDDFTSSSRFGGKLGSERETLRHGEWTRKAASLVAPSASLRSQDFNAGAAVGLSAGMNVLSLSYGMLAAAGYSASQIAWDAQEKSIIQHASNGAALVSKAAGNDAVAVGTANASGNVDYLGLALKGAPSALYVGALSRNGTVSSPARMAAYSNLAGADRTVQNQFLVVGVDGAKAGFAGTSFAAPIVSGYGAILSSKFKAATPPQIANQLLSTARQDTIAGYSAAVHGRGEASISRALAPVVIR